MSQNQNKSDAGIAHKIRHAVAGIFQSADIINDMRPPLKASGCNSYRTLSRASAPLRC